MSVLHGDLATVLIIVNTCREAKEKKNVLKLFQLQLVAVTELGVPSPV